VLANRPPMELPRPLGGPPAEEPSEAASAGSGGFGRRIRRLFG
jgi:hypothetical protein